MELEERDKKAKELIEVIQFIVAVLVDYPEQLKVSARHGEQTTIIEIKTAKEDVGKIIGKQGRNISALRVLLSCIAAKIQLRAIVQVIE